MEEVEILRNIGFTDNEAKVFQGLFKRKLSTATELSKLAGVSRIKVYDVLESLKAKGLCEEVKGKVKRYSAVSPDVSFAQLVEDFEKRNARLKRLHTIYKGMYENLVQDDGDLDFVNVLSSRQTIIDHLERKQIQAEKKVRAFVKRPYVMNVSNPTKINEIQHQKQSEGLVFKGVYEIDYDHLDQFMEMVTFFEEQGEEVRLVEKLPSKFFIFDDDNVIMMLKGKLERSVTAMAIEHADFANTLADVFDKYWRKGITIEKFKEKN